jgi:cyclase
MKTATPYFLRALAVAFILVAVSAKAQGQGGNGPDFSKVEIKTTQIAPNFYTLEGSGGTIGVLVGPDGIFMVDGEFAPLTPKIVAAIRKISDAPIRFLVNTHVHGDHTGGNENLAKMGVTIFARDEVRERLAHPAPAANGTPGVPAPAAALPVVTYSGPVTFHMDGEEVQLIPIYRAHTDGDTMVRFRNDDIIMIGDFFRSLGYPNIDRANGGSLNGMLDGLGILIGMMGPNTKGIPGHGATVGRAQLIANRDMILAVRDRVAALIAQGKTQQDVLAADPTADYDAGIPMGKETKQRFVTQVYAELAPAK